MRTGGIQRRRKLSWLLVTVVLGFGSAGLGVVLLRRAPIRDPLEAALTAYDRHDWNTAALMARARLKAVKTDTKAERLLARSSLRQDKPETALVIYDRLGGAALEAEDYYLLAMEHWRRKNVKLAIEGWEMALSMDAQHVETLAMLSRALTERDRFQDADRTARKLMRQPGWKARANLLLGEIHEMRNDPEQAAAALAIGLSNPSELVDVPDLPRYRKLLARSLLRTGHPAEARNALHQLQTTSGQPDPEACWMLSRCDLQEGKTSDPLIVESTLAYRDDHPLAPEPAPYVGAASAPSVIDPSLIPSSRADTAGLSSGVNRPCRFRFPDNPFPTRPIQRSSTLSVQPMIMLRSRAKSRIGSCVWSSIMPLAPVTVDSRRSATMSGIALFENRLSYYSSTRGWDVTSGQIEKPDQSALYQGSFLTPDIVWRCILCHHTNPTSIVNQTGPENADPAIGCERCHGPGGNHLLAVEHSSTPKDLAIARPAVTMGEPIIKLCGQCHDPRKVDFELTPGSASLGAVPGNDVELEPMHHREHRQARLRYLPQSPSRRGDVSCPLQFHLSPVPFRQRRGCQASDHPTRREENRSGCRFFMSGQSGD